PGQPPAVNRARPIVAPRPACAGRADRAARAGHRLPDPDAHGEPGRSRGEREVPPGRRPVPHQGLPEGRRIPSAKLTSQIVAKLQAYICERGLSDGDLLFAMPERSPTLKMLSNPDRLGHTEPNVAGRTYRHGTLSAYTAGRCRCEHCKG